MALLPEPVSYTHLDVYKRQAEDLTEYYADVGVRVRYLHADIDCGNDNGVSRRHAQLTTDGTRWFVEDLQSSNGTFVGDATGTPEGRLFFHMNAAFDQFQREIIVENTRACLLYTSRCV